LAGSFNFRILGAKVTDRKDREAHAVTFPCLAICAGRLKSAGPDDRPSNCMIDTDPTTAPRPAAVRPLRPVSVR
jgi:hypothetical protein